MKKLLYVFLIFCTHQSNAVNVSDFNVEKLNINIATELQKQNLPGIAIGLIHDNKIIYKAAFGYSDVKNNKPFGLDTRTSVGSITKVYVAMAIYRLIEEVPSFNTKTKIGEILPELHSSMHSITVGQLLSHTSGLRRSLAGNSISNFDLNDLGFYAPLFEDFKESILSKDQRLYKKAGVMPQYSNMAYAILGLVIKKVMSSTGFIYNSTNTSDQISQALNELVFNPLNVRANTNMMSPSRDFAHEAKVYSGVHKYAGNFRYVWKRVSDLGAAITHSGVSSDIDGLLKLGIELDHAMTRNNIVEMPAVLSSQSYEKWFPLQVRLLSDEPAPSVIGSANGALFYEKINIQGYDHYFIGHTGTGFGSRALMYVDPTTGVGVALIINSKTADRHTFAKIALEELYRVTGHGSQDRMRKNMANIYNASVDKLKSRVSLSKAQKSLFPVTQRPATLKDLANFLTKERNFGAEKIDVMIKSLQLNHFIDGAFGTLSEVAFQDESGKEILQISEENFDNIYLKIKEGDRFTDVFYSSDSPEGEAPLRLGFNSNFILFSFIPVDFTFDESGRVTNFTKDATFHLKARLKSQSDAVVFPQQKVYISDFPGKRHTSYEDIPKQVWSFY